MSEGVPIPRSQAVRLQSQHVEGKRVALEEATRALQRKWAGFAKPYLGVEVSGILIALRNLDGARAVLRTLEGGDPPLDLGALALHRYQGEAAYCSSCGKTRDGGHEPGDAPPLPEAHVAAFT